jgi:crossover junction endodeoxyribonuclease RusA
MIEGAPDATPHRPTPEGLGVIADQPLGRPSHQNPSPGDGPAGSERVERSDRSWHGQLGHGHIRPDTIEFNGTERRVWWLGLPFAPSDLPNLNHRQHWSQRAQLTKSWRATTHLMCKAGKIPPLPRILVALYYLPAVQRRRDPDNLVAALKPAVDGLVDAGVVPDDTYEYVRRDMPIILPPAKLPPHCARLALYIEELP